MLWLLFVSCVAAQNATLAPNTFQNVTNGFNYNPLLMQYVPKSIGKSYVDCGTFCFHTPWCQGFIESIPGNLPAECYIAGSIDNYTDVIPLLNQDKIGFTEFQKRNCRTFAAETVCYPLTRICLACPAFPTKWQQQIETGYTLYFTQECCSDNFHTEWLRTSDPTNATFILSFNETLLISTQNITIASAPGVSIASSACPLLQPVPSVTALTVQSLSINCTNTSSNAAGILVEYTPQLQLIVNDITVYNARSVVTVLGGSQDRKDIIPAFAVTDLANSYFAGLEIITNQFPVASVVALADYIGDNISLGAFSSNALVVVQPALDDNDNAAASVSVPSNIEVFNISAFTQIFGTDYEISFYHNGAFESNAETTALREILVYQAYLAGGLISLLIILHQDLFYYLKESQKDVKRVED